MESQFKKLVGMVEKASRFSFGLKKEYLGPVSPSAIVTFGSQSMTVNALVLAERVSALYLPFSFNEGHLEAVTVFLDENFEFQQYQPQVNEIMGLSVLVGDKDYSYDGTVAGAAEFFGNKNWEFTVLYERENPGSAM
ncbi:MAG: hypothetical protein ABIJ16_06580 [Bacteroidota bacterium]